MNHYETPVPKEVAENPRFLKFRRRLLSPRLNNPPPYTRALKLLGHGLAIICSVNIILFAEFPAGHCFTGIREWYAQKRGEFLRLSVEDQLEYSVTVNASANQSLDATENASTDAY